MEAPLYREGGEHPVIELMRQRTHGALDHEHLSLVIEGGGLRGALTAGEVAELEAKEYSPIIFDSVVASSSGAYSAAYYLSENAQDGANLYIDHLIQAKMAHFGNCLHLRPVLDLSVPVDDLLENVIPVNWDKVVETKKLHMMVSDPHEVTTKMLPPPRDKEELKNFLKATSHMPILSGRAPTIEGLSYYDGSLTSPLPIAQAIALGATHVLALSTRNLREWRTKQTKLERVVSRIYDKRWPGIDAAIRKGVETADTKMAELTCARDNPVEPPYIYTLEAPPRLDIKQFEQDPRKTAIGVEIGRLAIRSLLS